MVEKQALQSFGDKTEPPLKQVAKLRTTGGSHTGCKGRESTTQTHDKVTDKQVKLEEV